MQSSSRIGTELGGYRIDAVLGWGRNGVIYDAFDVRGARRVALDVLEPELSADPATKRRFVREARKASRLDHPNIVPLYAIGELDGQLYTAARFVDGDDLRTVVRREGPLSPARALFILQQAAHALDAAQAAGIPHRALDSEAILVERHSDHVYVCDFGLSHGDGAPLVRALGALLEEMLAGQDVPLALDRVLVTAAEGGKGGYTSGADLVRAARWALHGVTARGEAQTGGRPGTGPGLTVTATVLPVAAADAAAPAEGDQLPVGAGSTAAEAALADAASAEAVPAEPAASEPSPASEEPAAPAVADVPPAPPPMTWPRRLTAMVVDVLAVAVILGPVMLFAILPTDGPASDSSTTTTPKPRAATKSPSRSALIHRGPARALLAELDPSIRNTCTLARHPGGLATLLCSATGAKWGLIDVHVDRFSRPAILLRALRNEAFGSLVRAGGKRPVAPRTRSGHCDRTGWLGTLRWRRVPGPGYAVCFVARGSAEDCGRLRTSSCAVIYWTYQPEDIYVRAVAPVHAKAELYAWWREHRDRFGR